jgi:hypothetical protein
MARNVVWFEEDLDDAKRTSGLQGGLVRCNYI